jgi:uncharacterized protein YegP (UPF0339 family)
MKIEVYKDDKGEWRWRAIAPNGRVVAVAGEGFKHRTWAITSAETYAPKGEITNLEDRES